MLEISYNSQVSGLLHVSKPEAAHYLGRRILRQLLHTEALIRTNGLH